MREAQVCHMPFLGFQALPKFWSEIWFHVASQNFDLV